jgi:hypothetical protein
VIYGSETGRGARSWQIVRDRPYISGLFLWVGFDFLGEAGEWPSHGSTAGLFDRCGFPKVSARQFEAFWKETPVVRVVASPTPPDNDRWHRRGWYAPHWTWNSGPGDPMRVRVYSNCDEVELRLNGRIVGRQSVDESSSVRWSVPYEEGRLTAVGFVGDAERVSETLETAGDPVKLAGAVQTASLRPGQVVHLILNTVDASGVTVPQANSPVTVEVNGAGRLLGLDNGDQRDPTPLRSPTRAPSQGRLLALIEVGDLQGTINIRATAEGLESFESQLEVR